MGAEYIMARSEGFNNRPNTLPQTTFPHLNFCLQSGGGPYIVWGKESAPLKAHSGFRKGERASEGRGCSERGTLNADRKANRKGAALFNAPSVMARAAKASS